MAFTSPFEQVLAQRLAQRQAPVTPSALGPVLAAPIQSPPQLALADLIAGVGQSMTQLQPAQQQPAPSIAMAPSAGAAVPTQAGGSPLEALSALLGASSAEPQAAPRPDNLAGLLSSAAYPNQPNPAGASGASSMLPDWITGLFGGGSSPSEMPLTDAAAQATQAKAEASAPAMAQPVGSAVPTQQANAPTASTAPASTETKATKEESKTSKEISPIGTQVYEAISTALPELPKADADALKTVFQKEDLFMAMIAMGSAMSSGKSYGEGAAAAASTLLGAQNKRQQDAAALQKQRMEEAQQTFENKLEVAKLKKGEEKDQADAELARARADAARAGIAVTQEQVKLVQAQTKKNHAQAAKAGRDSDGKSALAPKDYAKLMLDVQNDMELNGTVPEDAPVTDESRVRVNLALPPELRQYAPVPSTIKEEVKAIAEKPALTPEDKTRLERYRLLYGPVI